jgi:glycosyltransferase involved in cell wall biosynthesis
MSSSHLRPDVVVVVRMHNEASSVGAVVTQLRQEFSTIVCVDDGSTDGSGAIARAAGARVVTHPMNLGGGAALQTGLEFASSIPEMRYVLTFDADGQHDVADGVRLSDLARDGKWHAVLGSRFLDARPVNMPLMRGVVLRAGTLFTRAISGLQLTDTHNGLRVLSREVVAATHLTLDGMAYASQLLDTIARGPFSYVEAPVTIAYTEYSLARGQSNVNALNIAFDLAVERLRGAR